ncbi:MAG: hypothetical protein DIU63_15965 [Proteobacteria bacterium]|nr:MAG: hypothetical protein DIU63_15965 [Pseudomonadota bacterium]
MLIMQIPDFDALTLFVCYDRCPKFVRTIIIYADANKLPIKSNFTDYILPAVSTFRVAMAGRNRVSFQIMSFHILRT